MKTRLQARFYRLTDPRTMRRITTLIPVAIAIVSLLLPGQIIAPDRPHTGGLCNGGG